MDGEKQRRRGAIFLGSAAVAVAAILAAVIALAATRSVDQNVSDDSTSDVLEPETPIGLLHLPFDSDWEEMESLPGQTYTVVVNPSDCDAPDFTDTCSGFVIIDTVSFEAAQGHPYGELDSNGCAGFDLRDGVWYTGPKVVEELTIAGLPAEHREHWMCNEGQPPTPPESADAAFDVMHSWKIGDFIVVDRYRGKEPLPGIEDMLANASLD